MDINSLELFADVIRQGNFTDVAHARDLAPSSVSRSITTFEQELGFRLFNRSTRKLEPTEAGMLYFQRIEPLIAELRSAREMAADVVEEPKGVLRITASVVYGEMYITPIIPKLAARYPKLTIELLLTDTYLDLIEERIDVAVRLGTLQDSNYIAKKHKDMKFYICASPEYLQRYGTPEIPDDVKDHNCLMFPRLGYNYNWLFRSEHGEIIEVPTQGNCMITNSRSIRQCAVNAMGLALLPDWLIQDEIHTGKLRTLFADYEVSATDYAGAVWIVYPSREYLPLKTRLFIEQME